MLQPETKQELKKELATPAYFIKRDGAKYPFETFKLEMIIHALALDEAQVSILTKIMEKLAPQ